MGILSREQGKVLLSGSSLTVEQFKRLLQDITEEDLSESGKAVYRRLNTYLDSDSWLGYESDVLKVGFDPAFQGEVYYKTNEDTPWIWDYHYRHPLFLLPVNISLGPWISAEMDVQVGQNEYAATLHDNYINVPWDPVSQFDIHFPKRAFFSAGLPLGRASGVNFTLGQGEDFFGHTKTGSIILSEYLERVTYGQLTIYSPAITYTAEVMQYEVNKYHYMHYLQIRPHKTISVSLSEGVMVNAPLELRFMNPFTVFHSYESFKTYNDYNEDIGHTEIEDPTDGSRIGSYFGARIEWQPIRYLRIYGLFAMDQLQLGVEKSHWEESLTPDALAFQGGAEVTLPARGGHWQFGLEGVYTYPYMYVLWDKHWSFYKENPEMDAGGMDVRYWTGSPFGPDSIAGAFWAGFHATSKWSAVFSFTVSAQGERSGLDIFDTDDYKTGGKTYRPTHDVYTVTSPPTGIPVYTYTASILGKWAPLKWLDLSLQPGYRYIMNLGHITGESAQGFEIAFSARIRPQL
ncbi:hypothetical protein FACS189447_01910 [Spirochaetia bacterium]|nr:hypothetical protein FACS189447_01910 [Spirochaetia bacterium]